MPPVVDIERLHDKDDQNFISDILSFLKSLESYYGGKPIIYSGLNFSNTYLTQLGGYPLWIAEYGVNEPKIPEGWSLDFLAKESIFYNKWNQGKC